MLLKLPPSPSNLKSQSQVVRVVTEKWAEENLYCPKCGSSLTKCVDSTPIKDFDCNNCEATFQLKSQGNSFGSRIIGAQYETTLNAIKRKNYPSLLLLQYDRHTGFVINVLAIHSGSITEDCIEARSPTKDRGWVGCNFLLPRILRTGRVPMVSFGTVSNKADVLKQWSAAEKLLDVMSSLSGWERNVMWLIDQLGTSFALKDIYEYETEISDGYKNKDAKAKIRQQLQLLRDRNLIIFDGNGTYSRIP